jgi:tetratricopeptide (TPR) repeat protein
MTRRRLLMTVILVELIAAGVLVYRKRSEPVPPLAELSYVDPWVATDIRERVETARTPDDWAALGELYMAYGYYPEAEACSRIAAERQPDRADRQSEWAFARERIGELEGANESDDQARRLALRILQKDASGDPVDPRDCWYVIGRNHARLGDVQSSSRAFESASDHPSARYELARLNLRSGQRSEAIAILDGLIAEYPDAVGPYLLRHRIEVETGSTRAAEFADKSDRARGRLPNPFDRDWKRLDDAYHKTGIAAEIKECELLIANGKVAEAEKRLQAVLQVTWDPAISDLLAEVAFLRGRPTEAVRILQEIVDRAGASPHFLDRLGDAWREAGEADRAVAAWQRAASLGIGAEIKNVHHKLGLNFEGTNELERARRHHALAYLAAGHEAFWNADFEGCLDALSLALEQESRLASAWFYRGEAHRLLGHADSARADYRQCLELDPAFGRAAGGLALLPGLP